MPPCARAPISLIFFERWKRFKEQAFARWIRKWLRLFLSPGCACTGGTAPSCPKHLGAGSAPPSRLMRRNASETRVTFVFSERDNYGNKKTFERRRFSGDTTSR